MTIFDKASREYQVYHHEVDIGIRLLDLTKCPSCGDPADDPVHPLQTEDGVGIKKRHACLDGNLKVPRLDSASCGFVSNVLETAQHQIRFSFLGMVNLFLVMRLLLQIGE